MQLTIEQAQRLKKKLAELWDKARCEICQSDDWKTDGHIYELREFRGSVIPVGAPVSVVPLIAIHCQKCGNTKLVSALAVGLVDPKTGERVDG